VDFEFFINFWQFLLEQPGEDLILAVNEAWVPQVII
jgi:hypothetical protein